MCEYCYVSQIRVDANLTQEEFYNDTGIHIGRIETATSNISVSTLDAICKYFKIGLEQFFRSL
ncbi:MAG: helix-turn-helix transcriptional regulator [Bacteroidetes bacterium]|nr:helix-turn-helix transcriptional regulator [Bacteroidota bacterium]